MTWAPNVWRNLNGDQLPILGNVGASLSTIDLNRALETMESLHDLSSTVRATRSIVKEPSVSLDSLTKALEATKLSAIDLLSVDKIPTPQGHPLEQENQSESSIPATTVNSNRDQDSELRSQSHPWASLTGFSFNIDDDDEDECAYASFDDDERSMDFTACSAEDCGYCGHCDY